MVLSTFSLAFCPYLRVRPRVVLRAVVLRAVVLRAVVLRAVVLRAVVLRADVLRVEPERLRVFLRDSMRSERATSVPRLPTSALVVVVIVIVIVIVVVVVVVVVGSLVRRLQAIGEQCLRAPRTAQLLFSALLEE